MQDLPVASLFAGAMFLLVVLVLPSIVDQYWDIEYPHFLARGPRHRGDRRWRSLLVVLPWSLAYFGGGHVAIALMLLHPASSLPVRILAATELVAAGIWLAYLARLVANGTRRKE